MRSNASTSLPSGMSGFCHKHSKEYPGSTQSLVFLGFMVNSTDMEIRFHQIQAEARKSRGAENVTARLLSQLIGKIHAGTCCV